MPYSHARWLYLIAARAEDLPMPEGFGLLPNTRHARPCMHFWYVYMHLFIRLPTVNVTTHLPTFDLSICFKFAQVLLCLVPIHPYIHDMSCNLIKHDSRKQPQGSKIRKIQKTKKILTKDEKRMAEAPWHNMMFRSLFLAVNNTAIPGVRRLRRVWTETPAAARLL